MKDSSERETTSRVNAIHSILLFVLATLILQACGTRETSTIHADLRRTLESSSFRTVLSTTHLPPAIVALCADDSGKLADPDQEWQSTDLTTNPSLPQKRLIWAAISSDMYVVHYEQGGRGHRFHVLAASVVSSNATSKAGWTWAGDPFKDHAAFQTALKSRKLDKALN